MIFIIMGFRTIVLIFIVISTTFHHIKYEEIIKQFISGIILLYWPVFEHFFFYLKSFFITIFLSNISFCLIYIFTLTEWPPPPSQKGYLEYDTNSKTLW